jgi:hypothetical protein
MRRTVALPSDSILSFSSSSERSDPYDFFDFPFRFAVDDVWGRLVVIGAMNRGLVIGREKRGMEDVVYLPMGREHYLVSYI